MHPLCGSQWNRGRFKTKNGSLRSTRTGPCQQKGFMGHVATDGFLLGNAGKWGACGWAVAQLDYDADMCPLHGMYLRSSAP